jgi:RimJ/RimL family protein N-acetyltransferase
VTADRAAHPRLTTDRLVLVPQTLGAARAVLAGEDPGLPVGEGYPHPDTSDALRMYAEHGQSDDDGGWFITLADDGRAIGDCGTLGWTDDEGRVEIGYGLAAPFRRQGYGTEAAGALADWVGAQPEVLAVTAAVEVGNLPSRRLLERLDFVFVGESDGRWQFTRSA